MPTMILDPSLFPPKSAGHRTKSISGTIKKKRKRHWKSDKPLDCSPKGKIFFGGVAQLLHKRPKSEAGSKKFIKKDSSTNARDLDHTQPRIG